LGSGEVGEEGRVELKVAAHPEQRARARLAVEPRRVAGVEAARRFGLQQGAQRGAALGVNREGLLSQLEVFVKIVGNLQGGS
jgi:hypothetical protein